MRTPGVKISRITAYLQYYCLFRAGGGTGPAGDAVVVTSAMKLEDIKGFMGDAEMESIKKDVAVKKAAEFVVAESKEV